ncbi:IPT/TIG domain-containing protein [Chloroflexota bacterium]
MAAAVIDLYPSSGSVGSTVDVYGDGFNPSTPITITYDGGWVQAATSNSLGSFTAFFTVPASSQGAHTVTATGTSTASRIFTVTVNPTITVSPTSGDVGTSVSVAGTGFSQSSSVYITFAGAQVANTTSNTYGSFNVIFTVPASTKGSNTVMARDAALYSDTANFTVIPKISLSPLSGAVGRSVSVTGSGFAASSSIYITYAGAQVANTASDTHGSFSAIFTVPVSARGSHTVLARDASGNSDTGTFTVSAGVSLSLTSGPVGSTVAITGNGFASNSRITVTYDGAPVTTIPSAPLSDAKGSFSFAFTVPDSTRGGHAVRASDAALSGATATFTVKPDISLSATTGAVGTTVTITGTRFTASSSITITYDGTQVGTSACNTVGGFTAAFTIPASVSGVHNIRASDSAGGWAESSFTVTPVITVPPTSVTVGPGVSAAGAGFPAGSSISITYDGSQVATSAADSLGSFAATFTVPPSVKGEHTVGASSGTDKTEATITVVPGLSLSLAEGHVGATVDIAGTGFAANSSITVAYDGATVATLTSDATGSLAASLVIPTGKGGEHTLSASDTDSKAQSTFALETTPPPAPEPLLPVPDTTERVLGSATISLDWSDVTDPSGVSYSLEVADNSDFYTPVLTKEGLADSEFTLTGEESLSRGVYYWRVNAVDGASNVGPWAPAQSFTVAFILPLWAMIVLAVVLVILGWMAIVYYLRRY